MLNVKGRVYCTYIHHGCDKWLLISTFKRSVQIHLPHTCEESERVFGESPLILLTSYLLYC